jgi:PilZ domain
MNESDPSRILLPRAVGGEDRPDAPAWGPARQLRDRMFNQVLRVLGLTEPRRAVRHVCPYPAYCRLVTLRASASWPASIQNISRGGVGLLAATPMEPGRMLALTLPGLDPPFAQPLCMTTVHVRRATDTHWYLGGAWTEPLSAGQVSTLLAAASSAG